MSATSVGKAQDIALISLAFHGQKPHSSDDVYFGNALHRCDDHRCCCRVHGAGRERVKEEREGQRAMGWLLYRRNERGKYDVSFVNSTGETSFVVAL